MPDHYTNMSTLLTAIKNRLLVYQTTTLSAIKTYKRGVLPPLPSFPSLAILPVSETLFSPRSGGTYRNDREINIEIYTKGIKTADTLRDNMDLVDAVKDALKTEYELNDGGTKATYDLIIGEKIIGKEAPFRNSMVQLCTIPITCRSLEVGLTSTHSTAITDVSGKTLLDTIYTAVAGYAYTNTIRTDCIKKATMPPCPVYPSIHVLEDTEFHERYEAGIDRPDRKFTIAAFNKQLDKEVLLDNLITNVEDIKDCLQLNGRFSNQVRNSWIPSIEYGSFTAGNTVLYSAFISLYTWGNDPVV